MPLRNYSDVAHPSQPEEHIAAWKLHVEQNDEEHCRSHQLAAVAAYVGQFYVFYLHFVLAIKLIILLKSHDSAMVVMA